MAKCFKGWMTITGKVEKINDFLTNGVETKFRDQDDMQRHTIKDGVYGFELPTRYDHWIRG